MLGRFLLGRLGGEVADEVVLTIQRRPPPPVAAGPTAGVACDGGRANVRFLLDLLAGRGLRVCDWREFLRRTEPDPLLAAATVALAEAPTVCTAAILLDQYHGVFAAALDAVTAALDRGTTTRRPRPSTRWRGSAAGPAADGAAARSRRGTAQRRQEQPGQRPGRLPAQHRGADAGDQRDVVTMRLAMDGWPVEPAYTAGVRDATSAGNAGRGDGGGRRRPPPTCACGVLDASAAPVWPEGGEERAVRGRRSRTHTCPRPGTLRKRPAPFPCSRPAPAPGWAGAL